MRAFKIYVGRTCSYRKASVLCAVTSINRFFYSYLTRESVVYYIVYGMLLAWYYPTRFAPSRKIFDDPCSSTRRETKGKCGECCQPFPRFLPNFIDFTDNFPNLACYPWRKKRKREKKRNLDIHTGQKKLSRLISHEHRIFTDKETRADLIYHKWSRIALALIVRSRFRSRVNGCLYS